MLDDFTILKNVRRHLQLKSNLKAEQNLNTALYKSAILIDLDKHPIYPFITDEAILTLFNRQEVTMTTKNEYLKEVKQKFDELNENWKIEREKIDGVTRNVSDEARKQVDEKRAQLRECRSNMTAKIEELKSADDNSWRFVMTGVDEAWKAVFDAFRNLVDDLKKR